MRAYRSWASARWGCRSRPVRATRCAASSWPFWRSSSPSWRKTRLSGSWASWLESVLISSSMERRSRPRERLRGGPGPPYLPELRRLALRLRREPLPLVPLLHRLGEATGRDQRVSEHAVRPHQERVEPQGAAQLLRRLRRPPGGEADAAEQQIQGRIVRLERRRLLGRRAGQLEIAAAERVLRARHVLGQVPVERRALGPVRPGVREDDHARAVEAEQRLGDFEVGAPQLGGDGADVAAAVHQRQRLPLRG